MKTFFTILASVVLSLGLSSLLTAQQLGVATTLSTATSDTIETFRTNVNTSIANLANNDVATTSANTWTALQTFSANASSSMFSANQAQFGGSATTSITNTGFLGVGTSSPWAFLSVLPDALGGAPEFLIGSTSATRLIVTGAGNIGIGTSSPAGQLQISNGASATTTLWFGARASTAKTCINMRTNLGGAVSLYVVGTTVIVEAKECL